ncbi:hypothetical protein BH11GEM1_BH11GEM1_27000 [soil metagenome]
MRFRLPVSCLALAAVVIACGGGTETTTPPVVKNTLVVTTVSIAFGQSQLEVGSTLPVTLDVRDQGGLALTGRTATWTSSAPAVASVDASGTITAVSVGTATITATVDGKSGSSPILVILPRVTTVTIALPAAIVAGQSSTLVATLKDKNGTALTGRVIAWTSSDTRIATIDTNGLLAALAAGTTTVTATSEDIAGQVMVVVAPPAGTTPPTITSIAPAVLTPGATATITGANFVTGPGNTTVKVAGVAATVTSATATQVVVLLPATGLPCATTQPVSVDVFTQAGTATAKQTLTVATTRALAVGASLLVTSAGNLACNELAQPGTYVVSVFNAATVRSGSAGFELKGSGPAVSASRLTPGDAARSITVLPPPPARHVAMDPALARTAHEHLQRLEHDLQLIHDLRPAIRNRRTSASTAFTPGSRSTSLTPVPLDVGSTTKINFNYNTCATPASPVITARVVYVGPKTVVLEDTASVLAGKIDADMIALAKEFETVSFPLLLNFGNPLAWDDSTDKNGRIIMMFTPKVNNAGAGLLGFVQSCDLFRPTDAPQVSASNQAEIFYARAVTDTSPTSTSLNGRPQWRRQMPSTLIHESKHITAFAERFADPRPAVSEEVWLEEATAQVASELYGRAIHGNGWRTNSGYTGVLECEVRPGTPACGQGNFVMGNHFLYLADFLQNFEAKTILSATDDNDIYGSSWMFVRWLTDTYGGTNEGNFLRGIVQSVTTSGVINVTTPSGKTWPELLSQFTLMLATDDLAGVSAPFTEASWNLPEVFAGYNRDLKNPPPASPLTLRQASFGTAFQASATLRGGGAMLLKIGAGSPSGTQVLDLHAATGAALPAMTNIGIAVLRLQ